MARSRVSGSGVASLAGVPSSDGGAQASEHIVEAKRNKTRMGFFIFTTFLGV